MEKAIYMRYSLQCMYKSKRRKDTYLAIGKKLNYYLST